MVRRLLQEQEEDRLEAIGIAQRGRLRPYSTARHAALPLEDAVVIMGEELGN
jgi:hypothetical protein